MHWKTCVIAIALLVLAVHGATAQETSASAESSASVQAFLQSLQPPAVSPETAGAPEALPLAAPANGVACCRSYPSCCSTTATVEACEDLGGEAFATTQLCAAHCCW